MKTIIEHWLAAGIIVTFWYSNTLGWIGLFLFILLVRKE